MSPNHLSAAASDSSRLATYTLAQRSLHWLIAAVVLILLAAGLVIGNLGYDGLVERFGNDTTNLLYKYHKTFGVLVLALMLLRLMLRLALGSPPYARPLPAWQSVASRISHWSFYLLLIAMPVVGWLGTAAGGYPVEFFNWILPGLIGKDTKLSEALFELHGLIGWVLIALVLVHVSAAVAHWLVWRDGVMGRISLLGRRA
jgi:cytochrome b561